MFSKTWTYLQYGNRFYGTEHTSVEGIDSINISVLKKTKKELELEHTYQVNSVQDVSKQFNKNQHIALVINNNQVLSKFIDSEQSDSIKLVYKAFPNINLDEFYYQAISEETRHFISICRKEYVETIINDYAKHHLHIIDINLGNNIISILKRFLEVERVHTSNAIITIENRTIKTIEPLKTKNEFYNINGQQVSNQNMLSFAGALNLILNTRFSFSNFKEQKDNLLEDYKQQRFFKQFLKFAGVFILVILLINFLFFNHYFNEVSELRQISQINQTTKDQIIDLNESVSKQQKMVDDLLGGNISKSTSYANAMMQSLPTTIILNEFNYQPLNNRIKPDKPIDLNTNTLTISGTSSNSDLFSQWIDQLEQLEWINSVDIQDYRSKTSSNSDFEIKALLNHD